MKNIQLCTGALRLEPNTPYADLDRISKPQLTPQKTAPQHSSVLVYCPFDSIGTFLKACVEGIFRLKEYTSSGIFIKIEPSIAQELLHHQ